MKISQHHNRPDLLQPVRSKEVARTDKRAERPAPSTPDFDKKKKIIAHISPISKIVEKENRSVAKPVVQFNSSTHPEPSNRSSAQKPGSKSKPKAAEKDEKKGRALESSEITDHSFEEEEKRIRRESLIKDFLIILLHKDASVQEDSKRFLWEYLKKNSKVHDVHVTYADELREVNLKKKFLSNFSIAAENHKFRFKLVRNFSRILSRLWKKPLDEVMAHGFKEVKNVKRQLHRANPRVTKKPVKSPPKLTAAFKSQVPTPTETTTLSASNGEIKRPNASKTPKIKKEDFSKKEAATPVKGTPLSKAAKLAKADPKDKNQKLDHLKSSGKKKGGLNSSLDENIYRSKRGHASMDASAEKNLRTSIEVASLVSKADLSKKASLPKLLDNSKHIVIKHQEVKDEIKKRLLQQVRGGPAEDEEGDYESRRSQHFSGPPIDEKKQEDHRLDDDIFGRKLVGTLPSPSHPRDPVAARVRRTPFQAQPRLGGGLQENQPQPQRGL
jgi:hypothetical protein